DCVGIFSKEVDSLATVLEVMAGADDFDSTVSKRDVPAFTTKAANVCKYKLAYIKETLESKGISDDVKANFSAQVETLKKEGHVVEEIEFPSLEYILPTYYILTWAEASSNLSRYDGVRYGYRSKMTTDIHTLYKKSRTEGFGEEVKRRIMLGTFVLSARYYDAYYTKAQKVRSLIRKETKRILKKYDFILTPTTPSTAFKIGDTSDPLEMYLADLYTVQASVAGLPAISLPCGYCSKRMPIGLQVMANDFQEANLLEFSSYFLNLNK
ncbi:MAG: amidase family protein, partial [Bacteroidota bacterium]